MSLTEPSALQTFDPPVWYDEAGVCACAKELLPQAYRCDAGTEDFLFQLGGSVCEYENNWFTDER